MAVPAMMCRINLVIGLNAGAYVTSHLKFLSKIQKGACNQGYKAKGESTALAAPPASLIHWSRTDGKPLDWRRTAPH